MYINIQLCFTYLCLYRYFVHIKKNVEVSHDILSRGGRFNHHRMLCFSFCIVLLFLTVCVGILNTSPTSERFGLVM